MIAATVNTTYGDWSRNEPGDGIIAHTLTTEHDASEDGTGRGTPIVPVGLQMNFIRKERIGDYVGTLAANPGNAQFNGVWQQQGVRRLTPLECERLQGFPDGWTEGFSDSVRYRMLGNSVAVPCVEWIIRRISLQSPPGMVG